jgi:hypothetical protein
VGVLNLLALAQRTGEASFRSQAEQALRGLGGELEQLPLAHVTLAQALARLGAHGEALAAAPRPTDEGLVSVRVRADGDSRLLVELEIASGWHVNANPAGPGLTPTLVEGTDVLGVSYPPGDAWRPATESEALPVYAGRQELRVELRPGAGREVDLVVSYQPCDASRCLAPVRRRLRVARPVD